MTHICVGNLTIIGSDNGLSPERPQANIWTNAGILLTGNLGTNFSEILIKIQTLSFKKLYLKISSGKWRPCCLGLSVIINRDHSAYVLSQREISYIVMTSFIGRANTQYNPIINKQQNVISFNFMITGYMCSRLNLLSFRIIFDILIFKAPYEWVPDLLFWGKIILFKCITKNNLGSHHVDCGSLNHCGLLLWQPSIPIVSPIHWYHYVKVGVLEKVDPYLFPNLGFPDNLKCTPLNPWLSWSQAMCIQVLDKNGQR